jgi:chromosome segregation ATPase
MFLLAIDSSSLRDRLTLKVIEYKQECKRSEERLKLDQTNHYEELQNLQLQIESQKNEFEQTIKSTQESFQRAEAKRNALEKELEDARTDLSQLQHEFISRSQISSETDNLLRQLREDKERLTKESQTKSTEVERLRREIADSNMSVIRANAERDQLNHKMIPLATENSELKKKLANLSDERDTLQLKVNECHYITNISLDWSIRMPDQ